MRTSFWILSVSSPLSLSCDTRPICHLKAQVFVVMGHTLDSVLKALTDHLDDGLDEGEVAFDP